MKYIVMVLTNSPDPKTMEYSGTAFHDRGEAYREMTDARHNSRVKYAWIRTFDEEPLQAREWNIFKDRIGDTKMNKPVEEWTFGDLEHFISEYDLSIKEVMALLCSGMTEMMHKAHEKHNLLMETKYRIIIAVIVPMIFTDFTEKY